MPTHGSLTKAGKVRAQTPRIAKTSVKPRKGPRIKNRSRYIKMLAGKSKNELDNRTSRRR